MTDSRLFGRAARITIGTTQINLAAGDGLNVLACTFKVTKNLKGEPNTAELKIRNLAPETRAKLETAKLIPTIIEVGYGSDLHQIYSGELRNAKTARVDLTDLETGISTGDGENAVSAGRALELVPGKASASQILGLAAKGLLGSGVGKGNLDAAQQLATATFGGVARVLHGNAARVFTDACTSNGMNWSIQDGVLQVLKVGAMVKPEAQAVKLSASSGLVGVPSVDTKGILKCQSLIQPGLMPGLPVVLDAENVKGAYRIEEAEFSGATWGDEWYVDLTCRKWK